MANMDRQKSDGEKKVTDFYKVIGLTQCLSCMVICSDGLSNPGWQIPR